MATVAFGDFEWDDVKAAQNLAKHGVSFVDASYAFLDDSSLDLADESHPDRLILVGMSLTSGLLYVVYMERAGGDILRIISARKATKHERRRYEQRD
jgi:uncharacterized protein